MESSQRNSCSVIQYYRGPDTEKTNSDVKLSSSFENQTTVKTELNKILIRNSESINAESNAKKIVHTSDQKGETSVDCDIKNENIECISNEIIKKPLSNYNIEVAKINKIKSEEKDLECPISNMGMKVETDLEKVIGILPDVVNNEGKLVDFKTDALKSEIDEEEESAGLVENENLPSKRGKKRRLSEINADSESASTSNASAEDPEVNEEDLESEDDDEEEMENKPRRRGRCKKNPDIIPSHLSSDIVLGYKILLKFLETPQFSGFHKPFKRGVEEEYCKITCLNQIKKKFEINSYNKVSEFVNDVREMLINIYESRNSVAIKKALRLEQILEQRIAQLPNYLRPQCALVLSPEEISNSHNKIRISKGGGFVSLLLEKTEKKRYKKNREKRKLLAEERKQLKEEQDKDVQEWEKNVLLKDFEEEIKSMWELPAIGHFIHLCADILNIGEVAQFEVERMLLMPQCSDTLDLIMTALLTNSLVRAKLDRTPSMPYSIWSPLVRTRVFSWYRTWHKEGKNEQKLFEEIGIEPDFWQILGPEINPLDYYYFHELGLLQRVWILKTLCDVDFVRKKTVHDNIRAQTLDELNPVHLGLDQFGNRYIQFKQFCGSDIRIYRQSTKLEGDISPSELIESLEGFEYREGPITLDKVFRDVWELNEKPEVKVKKKKVVKVKRARSFSKVVPEPAEKKNLRRSVRAKQKTYTDWSDSDQSDTDLITLKKKLTKPDVETLYRPFSDKEFISLSVFRLPRDKVNKPTSKRSSYANRKTEDSSRNDSATDKSSIKNEVEERKEDTKPSGCEDEQGDSLDVKQMQDIRADFQKIFQADDMNGDEFDLGQKINNCKLDKDKGVKFTIKNLENLKMVLTKGHVEEKNHEETSSALSSAGNTKSKDNSSSRKKEYNSMYKYKVPEHLKPDSSKFYLVVDSVEGLRQLISKFGSHENDLEIITRSTKSKKKSSQSNTSSEVQLIEKLQNLLLELEPWEFDLMKSNRTNKEKMYKEYMNFINRPSDFVHPNESYWMKTYEEPSSNSSTTAPSTTVTTTIADGSASNADKFNNKEDGTSLNETVDTSQQDNSLDILMPRKRTRVTRMQLQPENNDSDDDFDIDDDYESNESDDNWVLPTPKRKSKKEITPKISKVPRRTGGRRTKPSPLEKNDSPSITVEKSQNLSPEKVKKALFWGPRSSDPSEDLNWEKNRQKILEQHNSPVKKVLFKSEEEMNDMTKLETALQHPQNPATTVITASPKRLPTQIPGNKKPYYSSAQLKAMEIQSKKSEIEGGHAAQENFKGLNNSVLKSEAQIGGDSASPENLFTNNEKKPPVKIQTYSRIKSTIPNKAALTTSQTVGQQPPKQIAVPVTSKIDVAETNSKQLVKFSQKITKQMQSSTSPIRLFSQKIKNTETLTEASGQKSSNQMQYQQTPNRAQQIQIQQPVNHSPQSKTIPSSNLANVKIQQPVQWQPKVVTVQTIGQAGKVVQQQVQTQSQVQYQSHPQVQISNQSQVQGQIQQLIRLESPKMSTIQQPAQLPADKLGEVPPVVISQAQTPSNAEDLYITDGKLLMKFDNNFIQQYLQKDKVLTLNVNEKFDLKKPLLIVKPKAPANPSTSQAQPQTSTNQNILVLNKPASIQPTVVSTSVPNFVIPGNYIIKEENQAQTQSEPQTVKIVQQTPAYVLQQKAGSNKAPQPQIIKIITSQPITSNQNLILNPANINQVIQPMTQTVLSDQSTKSPTTIRFVRPQSTTSTPPTTVQNKINNPPAQIIVNNVLQIPSQRLDASKSPTSVVSGRIVTASIPTIRMTSSVQTPTLVPSTQVSQTVALATNSNAQSSKVSTQSMLANTSSQVIRTAGSPITQTVRLISGSQPQQIQNQTIVVSTVSNPQFVTSLTNINPQTLRLTAGVPTQQGQSQAGVSTSNSQCVWTTTNVGAHPIRLATAAQTQTQTVIPSPNLSPQLIKSTQPIRLATSAQPQHAQTQTLMVSANAVSQLAESATALNIQSAKTSPGVQSQPVQTQTIGSSANPQIKTAQSVRIISGLPHQPVKFVTNNNIGIRFVNKNVAPIKGNTITSVAQPQVITVSNIRPSGIAGQPVRFQTVVQTTGTKPAPKQLASVPAKTNINISIPSNSSTNAINSVIIKFEKEQNDVENLGERNTEPPVTVDYIHGELSVKKTSQGWKYAVKASNGKDIILSNEQIEERLKVNNGVLK